MFRVRSALVLAAVWLCAAVGFTAAPPAALPATITFAHINDVYEIDAIEGGAYGGLSRVATVLDRLRQAGPVVATLGGDFLSPSAIGTARVDGEPILGKQMVAVLNAIGIQWATLGNHEFDLPQAALAARLIEAKFKTVVSNVTDVDGHALAATLDTAIAQVRANGRIIKIGFIGLVTDFNKKPWVKYLPPVEIAKARVATLKGKVDAIVALTHLLVPEDQAVLEAVPEIDLLLGGHEHENWFLRRGASFAPIVKADANARSVAVVTMKFGATGRPTVSARFELIDKRVPMQARTQALVRQWMNTGFEAFKKDGFFPEAIVTTIPVALDGREITVRRREGDLTTLVAAALKRETGADVGVLNGGSIRIDDVIQAGPVRQYDIIRIAPFGGKVLKLSLDGATLARVFDAGVANLGIGGFLHLAGASRQDNAWLVAGKPIDPAARYTIGIPEFLLTGGESRLDFLNRTNPQIRDVKEFRDIRTVVMDELKTRFGRSGLFSDGLQRIPVFTRR
jgi:5'-nucleotidase